MAIRRSARNHVLSAIIIIYILLVVVRDSFVDSFLLFLFLHNCWLADWLKISDRKEVETFDVGGKKSLAACERLKGVSGIDLVSRFVSKPSGFEALKKAQNRSYSPKLYKLIELKFLFLRRRLMRLTDAPLTLALSEPVTVVYSGLREVELKSW